MTVTTSPRYGRALAMLFTLTAVSYGACRLGLGSFAIPVALGIAAVKIGIVLTHFMHVRREVASAGIAMLIATLFTAILMAFVILEITSRVSFVG